LILLQPEPEKEKTKKVSKVRFYERERGKKETQVMNPPPLFISRVHVHDNFSFSSLIQKKNTKKNFFSSLIISLMYP
jgi:hypothetical protein